MSGQEYDNSLTQFSKPRIALNSEAPAFIDDNGKFSGTLSLIYPLNYGEQIDLNITVPIDGQLNFGIWLQSPLGYPLGGTNVAKILRLFPHMGLGLLRDESSRSMVFGFRFGLTYLLSRDISFTIGAKLASFKNEFLNLDSRNGLAYASMQIAIPSFTFFSKNTRHHLY